MRDTKLDRLFLRFRDKGDVRALSRVFDLTSRELLELAAHVTRDVGQAEDLLQSTFLIAIERARQYEGGRGLMPWLVGILTREAKLWNRRAARRIEVDRLDERESLDPAVELEARELSSAVIEALDKLPQLYRDVLVRHLRDNQSAIEIARELDRSPGTVRVQIHRGLELLKKSLPAGLVAGAIAATLPRGLAAVRDEVVRHATLAARTLATAGVAGVAGSTIVGGIVVKKLVVCGVALLLAGFLWTTLKWTLEPKPDVTAESGHGLQPLGAEGPASSIDEQIASDHRSVAGVGPESAAHPATLDTTGSLRVHAVWAADGLPAVGITIDVSVRAAGTNRVATLDAVTDNGGIASFASVAAGRVSIVPDRAWPEGSQGASYSVEIKPKEETLVHVTLPLGVDVDGVILDEHGDPLAGASVWLSTPNSVLKGHVVAMSASDGSFRVRSVSRQSLIGARARGYAPTELRNLGDPIFAAVRKVSLRLELGQRGGSLCGVVRDPLEHPVASAEVYVGGAQGGPEDDVGSYVVPMRTLADGSSALPARPVFVRTDPEGRFSVDDIEAGEVPIMVMASGWPTWLATVSVEVGETSSLDVRLSQAVTITGTIRHRDGTPAVGVDVMAASCLRGIIGQRVRTDGRGHYEVHDMVAGDVNITANKGHDAYNTEQRADEGAAGQVLHTTPGAQLVWDATLPVALSISGRALDEQGSPLSAWVVRARPPEGGFGDMCITHPDGSFVIKGCKDATYRVDLRHGSSWTDAPSAWLTDVRPGGGDIVLRVSPLTRPSAFIRGTLLDADGRPVAQAVLYATLQDNSNHVQAQTEESTGDFTLGPLSPGKHGLTVQARGYPYRTLRDMDLAPEQTLDLGRIVLESPSSLRVTLRRADGRAPVDVQAKLVSENPQREVAALDARVEGSLSFDPVDAGSYFLLVRANECGAVRLPVILPAGQETRMEVILDAGTLQPMKARFRDGASAGRFVRFTLRNAASEVLFEEFVDNPKGSSIVACSVALAPGGYELEVSSERGFRSARAGFEVSASIEQPVSVDVQLERN